MTSYINRRSGPTEPAVPARAPQRGGVEGADFILWAAAQNQAISKLQIYSTMAKQVNDQQ